MRFCTNCGKALDDDAAFCIGCGTSTGSTSGENAVNQPESSATVSAQANAGGAYYQAGTQSTPSGAYYQSGTQVTPPAYTQPGMQNTTGTPYYQAGTPTPPNTPYYQQGAQGAPNAPYYQTNPYGGGPGMPGGPKKNNKLVIIIVSVIVGLALIVGGILFYLSRTNNNKDDDVNVTDDVVVSVKPSEDVVEPSPSPSVEPEESEEPSPSEDTGLDMFDSATQDNIIAACEEIGIDVAKMENLESYGTWFEGEVYTFDYDGSVIDLLMYDDGTVFSIETNGTQIYLIGYESYYIDDYLGYTEHFDESYPDNGYAFYLNGKDVDSTVTFETSYDLDYVIELVDANTGDLASAFYIRSGMTWSMDVPTGDYYIQYAVGTEWSGVDYLFGDGTTFYKSDSIYSFYPENESTITLDVNGGTGIASTEITIDDF